ncbi:uncharacterized protein N7500_009546 [Penicillium coprophilum]|uniref:uncharacterized protein n=1 Tax=Penicillium coprophilum TaxID=36646 RepID=UPI00239672CE|nr:uncharacterized protein N7500_009546 [Penicillium coprophilum]KAJ5154107.1 hypothetical protein N7500_009546 [Penicillium coprophilum]
MAARQSTPTSDSHSDSNVRKRVCKACDRCRLKKSKTLIPQRCDGSSPCSRCRADNAICVFGERKKAHDKVYPKGTATILAGPWPSGTISTQHRRRRLARRAVETRTQRAPLTHDLLMRLGALDGSKGERFEENPEALQQDLWHTNAGMQRQESSDGGSDSPQSPVARSRFSSDAFSQHMPPTPPTYSPTTRAPIKTEPQPQMPNTPQFTQPMSMQGVVNPLALQGPQQWPSNGFNPFDEMDLMSTDYSNLPFDDQQLSPMFNRPAPMNCLSQGSYLDSKNDYEDFNQFLNPNPTEITSI